MSIASFDVIVVGAGPAGLTAATGAARAGLKALCLDKLAPGGALINLAELHDVEEPCRRTSDRLAADRRSDGGRRRAGLRRSREAHRLRPVDSRDRRRRATHRPRRGDRHRPQQGHARPARGKRVRRPRPLPLRLVRRAALCRPAGRGRRHRRLGATRSGRTAGRGGRCHRDRQAGRRHARRRASPRRPHRRARRQPTACSRSSSRRRSRGRPFRPARCSSMSASLPLRNSCRKRLHATPPGISLSTKGAAPRQPRHSPWVTCGRAPGTISPTPSPTDNAPARPS